MKCKYCGAALEKDEIFCGECGRKIEYEQQKQQHIHKEFSNSKKITKNKKKSSSGHNAFMIIVGIFTILCVTLFISTCIIFFMKKPDSSFKLSTDDKTVEITIKEQIPTDTSIKEFSVTLREANIKKESEFDDLTTSSNGNYIISDSNTRELKEKELDDYTEKQLYYARNEIYARHGRIFSNTNLREYFESRSWYNGKIKADDFDKGNYLSRVETKNAALILSYEKQHGYDYSGKGL